MCVDYSLRTYEDWLNFAIHSTDEEHKEVQTNSAEPLVLVEYFTRVCMSLKDLCGFYSWQEIDRLIWNTLCNPFWMGDIVVGSELSLEPRSICVGAMYEPFASVVAKNSECLHETDGFYMWWDIVCNAFCAHHGHFEDTPFFPEPEASRRIHDKLLEVLERILRIPDPGTQRCALHGLGHIHHPKSADIVQRFIDKHKRECDEHGLKWLYQCRDGTVM